MKITLNKKEVEIDDGITVEKLLEVKGAKRAAVWINGRQLLISDYPKVEIKQGDVVKLLRVVAGG